MPIGLMDDIYDFISKFAERIDDLEEVILQQIQQFHLLQFEEGLTCKCQLKRLKMNLHFKRFNTFLRHKTFWFGRALLNEIEQQADLKFPRKSVLFPHYAKELSFHVLSK